MTLRLTCPDCQAVNTWDDYCLGKKVRCPRCRNRFLAEKPAADPTSTLPVAEPLDPPQAEEVPEALPAEPMAVPPELPEDLSPEVKKIRDRVDPFGMNEHQHLLHALLLRTFDEVRPSIIKTVVAAVFVPPLLGGSIVAGFLVMLAAYGLLTAGGLVLGPWALSLLYVIPILVIVIARGIYLIFPEQPVEFCRNDQKQIDHLRLGRLNDVLHVAAPATLTIFFGVLFGGQIGLLYFTPDHVALPIEGGFLECCLLTVDNLCHGVFLDTFELYDINVGTKLEHNTWSASVFYGFRLAYEGLVVLFGFQVYQHWKMRHLFRDFPEYRSDVSGLAIWMESTCGNQEKWPRRFFDEFLFLLLAGAYLRHEFGFVRQMSERFPWIRVAGEVRQLFVDQQGKVVFHDAPAK